MPKKKPVEQPRKLPKSPRALKDLYFPPKMCARNLEIWRQCTALGLTQKAVAEKQNLSPGRIGQIVRAAARYVALVRPYGGQDWQPNEQIAYSNQVHKLRLEEQYAECQRDQEISRTRPTVTEKVRLVEDLDADLKRTKARRTSDLVHKKVPQGDVHFHRVRQRITAQLVELDRSQAQVPLPPRALYPEWDSRHMTHEEKIEVVQQIFRGWYDEQQRRDSLRSGLPAQQWPIDLPIDIDGSMAERVEADLKAAYAKPTPGTTYGDGCSFNPRAIHNDYVQNNYAPEAGAAPYFPPYRSPNYPPVEDYSCGRNNSPRNSPIAERKSEEEWAEKSRQLAAGSGQWAVGRKSERQGERSKGERDASASRWF